MNDSDDEEDEEEEDEDEDEDEEMLAAASAVVMEMSSLDTGTTSDSCMGRQGVSEVMQREAVPIVTG